MTYEYEHWTIEERSAAQYNYFVLLGPKGMTQAYPSNPKHISDDFSTREEALSRATLASKAPEMLRLLKTVERSLQILSVDDVGAQRLLEQVQQGLGSVAKRSIAKNENSQTP